MDSDPSLAALAQDDSHFILPTLINAHDHLQLNAIPPLRPHGRFPNSYGWIDAFESHRKRADVADAIAVPSDVRHWHGGLKNLLAGATTVAHHDPLHAVFDQPGFPVGVVRQFGWSHSLGLGTARSGGSPRYGPEVQASFAATPADQPWMIHLAEGTDDVAAAELAQLDALGCLAANTVLVHATALSAADVECVISRGAAVVWCPSSNIELFGRTLNPRRLFEAGRLALGTDSRLTGSLDLLDELRVAAANSDLSPGELVRLVTTGAASVLRLPPADPSEPSSPPDCLIIRAGSHSDPSEALLSARRRDIRAVVRRGLPVIADLDLADWFRDRRVDTVEILLDGCPKLLARDAARPDAMELEPGLEIPQRHHA